MITWHLTNEPISKPSFTGLADPKVVSLVGRLGRTGWHMITDERLPRDHVYCGRVEISDYRGAISINWSGGMDAIDPVVMCHPASIATIGHDIETMRLSGREALAQQVREAMERLFGPVEDDDQ